MVAESLWQMKAEVQFPGPFRRILEIRSNPDYVVRSRCVPELKFVQHLGGNAGHIFAATDRSSFKSTMVATS